MPARVLDASALAALVFGEPEQTEVLQLIGDAALHAPALIDYEIGNVCWKKMQRAPAEAEKLMLALQAYSELALTKHDVDMQAVAQLALRTKLTFYDAAYLWLARALECELVTLDEKLRAAVAASK